MFSKIIQKINLKNYERIVINTNQIKAQYNPDRFKFWNSLHEGPSEEVLDMIYSPHYRFLEQYSKYYIDNIQNTPYYKLQKLYGRNDKWIKNKINKFIELFKSIKENGCKDDIIILRKPLVKNIYNNSFEIFEGHHRHSCCLILENKTIRCKILKEELK